MSIFFKGARESVLLKVTAKCPTDDGREYPVHFKVRYLCPDQEKRREYREASLEAAAEIREGRTPVSSLDDQIVQDLVTGWEGVLDKNDEPIEFTPESLADAMSFPPYREAIVSGAISLIFGKEAVRLKNSSRRGNTG